MMRLLPWLVAALAALSLLTGCSVIGYAVGSAADSPGSTYSIKNDKSIESYVGRTVTVIDSNFQRCEAVLDSVTGSSDSIVKYFYLSQRFSVSDKGKVLKYSADEVLDILVTDAAGTTHNSLLGIGLFVDIAVFVLFIHWLGSNWH